MKNTKSQMESIIEMTEKVNIMELEYRYVRSVDRRDWKTSVEVFAKEGQLYVVEAGKQRLIGGKPKIEMFFREIAGRDFIFARHSITNPIVRLEGNDAYFSSYFHTMFVHDSFTKVNFGYYDDKLVKKNGGWKLLEKKIIVGWSDFLIPLKQLRLER